MAIIGHCSRWALSAQGTADDYRRAYALRKEFSNKVYYGDVRPQWIGNTHKCWYTNHTPEGKQYVLVDAQAKSKKALFNQSNWLPCCRSIVLQK